VSVKNNVVERYERIINSYIQDIIHCFAPIYGRKLAKMLASKDLECQNIRLLLEQEPIENNKITLDDKKDKFKIPKVRLFYKKDIHTIRTAKLFLEEFANLCRKDDLGRVAIKNNIVDLEGFNYVGDGGHHMGGTRMGTDKNKSVVDNNLKVHDINNLYIGGSSNFVTGGYTNPTLTIIQFSIRLAEKISERLNADDLGLMSHSP
jgi:choline dehydrogenase-like flavoprotein